MPQNLVKNLVLDMQSPLTTYCNNLKVREYGTKCGTKLSPLLTLPVINVAELVKLVEYVLLNWEVSTEDGHPTLRRNFSREKI